MKINKYLPWHVTAVLSVGAALLITSLLWPLMSQSVFLFFIFAVGFSAHFRGIWAGLLATGLGILATTSLFFLPSDSWHLESAKRLIPILIFGALGIAVSLLTGAGQKVREVLRETVKVKDESLALLEALLATAPIGIAFHDLEGRYVRINETLAAINGLPAEQHLGRRMSEMIPEVGRKKEARLKQVIETGEAILGVEISGMTPAEPEKLRHWVASYYPVRQPGGQVVGTGILVAEVTERKQAEDELRRQKEILQSIFDHIPVMISFFDENQRTKLVNRQWERTRGWTLDELRRQNVDVLGESYPDPQERQRVQRFIASANGEWGEFKTRSKDGHMVDTSWAINRLSDGTCVAIGQDITARKRLEDQFRQAQKMEAIGRLAGGVAHDFNNLLTVIIGYSQMSLDRLDRDNPARLGMEEVLRAGQRAAALTNQLLAFSRKQVFQPKVFSLNETISDLQKMLCRLIGEDVRLVTSLEPDGCFIESDPGQIQQVIMNLAVNARDAMPAGGKLTIKTARVDVDAAYAARREGLAPGSYAVLLVSDSGCGMDQETLSHIFEPFFTTKEQGKGTGLGLATVYGIVKQNHGYLAVSSRPGAGATFTIYLPRVEPQRGSEELRGESVTTCGGTETILLAEDDAAVRSLAAYALREQGYTVWEAADGREALSVLEAHPDEPLALLVTDVIMPKMNGFELADHLRLSQPGTPTLFVSGYPERGLMQGRPLNKDERHLPKPFTPAELLRRMREVLDEYPAAYEP